jgi:hypothetical protein
VLGPFTDPSEEFSKASLALAFTALKVGVAFADEGWETLSISAYVTEMVRMVRS